MLTTKALQPDLTTVNCVVKGLENCRVDEFLVQISGKHDWPAVKRKDDQIKKKPDKQEPNLL